MGQENQSAVQSIIHEQNKMAIAITPGTTLIERLIPYLEYRELAARRYFDYPKDVSIDQTSKDELAKLVENCNEEIKKILGL